MMSGSGLRCGFARRYCFEVALVVGLVVAERDDRRSVGEILERVSQVVLTSVIRCHAVRRVVDVRTVDGHADVNGLGVDK